MPKCLLCLAGYLAIGGAAVELCGAGTDDSTAADWIVGGTTGAILVLVGSWRALKFRHTVSASDRMVR